jgi:NitT/TauT family transport system ATP-binding protein
MSLTIKELKKSFGNKQILDGFSYNFPEVGLFVLKGESGAGKTTLLRMIAGLDTKYFGNITGNNMSDISFAFQEYRLFPNLSALENALIGLGNEVYEAERKAAKELLIELGLDEEDFDLFPGELSGGMKQRVSLTRAFLKPAKILLLDEPAKELDARNRRKLYNIISREAERKLVILVSHNEDEINNLNATVIPV